MTGLTNLLKAAMIGLFIVIVCINNKEVISARDMAHYNSTKRCQEGCEKQYTDKINKASSAHSDSYSEVLDRFYTGNEKNNCILSCYASSSGWRDATAYRAKTIIQHITGGLFVTTTNILDGTIGGIVFVIKELKNGHKNRYFYDGDFHSNNFSDITMFSDFIFKNGLHYEWHYVRCYCDLLSKDKVKDDRSFCFFYFKDYIRIATNIVVCIIFICLVIRICSFNFRDGIFEIIGGRK